MKDKIEEAIIANFAAIIQEPMMYFSEGDVQYILMEQLC
jgi:hypothetical protein